MGAHDHRSQALVDAPERLTSAQTRDATSTVLDELTFGYDPAGNLTERDDDGETTWFAYDAADQLTDTMGELGDVLLIVGDPATLTSGDTAVKDRLQTTLGATVTVRDDAASELTSGYDLVVISESVSSTTVGSTYDADAAMPVLDLEHNAWDDHGLTSTDAFTVASGATTVDVADLVHPGVAGPAGDLAGDTTDLATTGGIAAATAASFTTDAVRLVEAPSSSNAVGFVYARGATLADTSAVPARRAGLGLNDDAAAALTADGWVLFDNLVRWTAGVGYGYDGAGNLVGSDAGLDLGYDPAGATDGLTDLDGGNPTAASYAGSGQYERATLGSDTFTHSLLGITTVSDGTSTVGYGRDPAGQVLTIRDGTDHGYLIPDAQGSTIAVTDNSGAVVNRYDYTPYGRTVETTASGAVDNPWRYLGQHHDDTGFYKLGIRYYHPDLARFTQPDPAYPCEALPYTNEYLYTAANPTSYSDPAGASPIDSLLASAGWFLASRALCGGAAYAAGVLLSPYVGYAGFYTCTTAAGVLWTEFLSQQVRP